MSRVIINCSNVELLNDRKTSAQSNYTESTSSGTEMFNPPEGSEENPF